MKEFRIAGDLYIDSPFENIELTNCKLCNRVFAKGDVFFGVTVKPKDLKKGDYYMEYEAFTKKNGLIYDIVAFASS
jgi:hypothetical protein